jgi:hypothetical protein
MRLLVCVFLALMQVREAAIEGVVVQVGTNDPVAGAHVLLTKIDGHLKDSIVTRTDDRGRFAIRDLPSGRYRIFADQDDFVRSEGETITVDTAQSIRDVRLTMTPTGVITGRVLDENNDPVAKVYVRAVKNQTSFEAQTNDLGEFRIFGLPPGSYTVSAAPYLAPRIENGTYVVPTPPGPYSFGEGQGKASLARLLQSGDFIHPMALSGETYAQVYYPGTTDRNAATPVDVRSGAVVGAIDFRIAITR